MTELFYQWIDLLWIPIGLLVVHKNQRIKTLFFMLSCVLTLRLQMELMDSVGHPYGFLPFLNYPAYERGLAVYGLIFVFFLILAYFSPKTEKIVFFAASLSIYIMAFCISMIVMVL